jgi:dihydropteroate synthase
MGILNLTPDSFYDGGKIKSDSDLLSKVERLLQEGATFLDVGGYSSRPGSDFVSEETELKRVLPAIRLILDEFPDTLLSIDTFRSSIAYQCVKAGASLVNDISGGSLDKQMLETIAKLKVPFIMMHMVGTPENMMKNTHYDHLTNEIMHYFSEKISRANEVGINDIIIDPGFGFSKTRDQNFELLNELELFKHLELPILIGVSRKSFIYKTLKSSPEEALNGTTVLNSIALFKGANILRVHDVKEAVECVNLLQNLKSR